MKLCLRPWRWRSAFRRLAKLGHWCRPPAPVCADRRSSWSRGRSRMRCVLRLRFRSPARRLRRAAEERSGAPALPAPPTAAAASVRKRRRSAAAASRSLRMAVGAASAAMLPSATLASCAGVPPTGRVELRSAVPRATCGSPSASPGGAMRFSATPGIARESPCGTPRMTARGSLPPVPQPPPAQDPGRCGGKSAKAWRAAAQRRNARQRLRRVVAEAAVRHAREPE